MTMANIDERIAELDKRQEQLQARKKKLLAQKNQKERKARTKRLIEIGASVESVLGKSIEKEDLPKLINFLKEYRVSFSKAMEKNETESADSFIIDNSDFL